MRKRRWTVMVVPPGCEATRSWTVTERMLKALRSGAVAALLLLVGGGAAIGMRVGQVAPGLAMGGASDADLAELRLKIATLQDTIESLGKRDEQLRLLAGIPSADSAVAFDTGAGTGTVAGTLAEAPAPSRFPAPFRRTRYTPPVAGDLRICPVGQWWMYQLPVSTTIRLPSPSSSTSLG